MAALQFEDRPFFGSRGGLSIVASPRDFARLGWLWLNQGTSGEGREVLSEKLYVEHIKPGVPADLPRTKIKGEDYLGTGTSGGGTDQTPYGPGCMVSIFGSTSVWPRGCVSGRPFPRIHIKPTGLWNRDTVTVLPESPNGCCVCVGPSPASSSRAGPRAGQYNQNLKLLMEAARFRRCSPGKDWEVAAPEIARCGFGKRTASGGELARPRRLASNGVHELMMVRNGRVIWQGDDWIRFMGFGPSPKFSPAPPWAC